MNIEIKFNKNTVQQTGDILLQFEQLAVSNSFNVRIGLLFHIITFMYVTLFASLKCFSDPTDDTDTHFLSPIHI
jgi:hypothetical protein